MAKVAENVSVNENYGKFMYLFFLFSFFFLKINVRMLENKYKKKFLSALFNEMFKR